MMMGAEAHLYIAGYPIIGWKNGIDPAAMTMFGAADKRAYVRRRSEANTLLSTTAR